MPPLILLLGLALIGLVVGSFLNVCIYRLPRGQSVVWPASHCPHCRRPLRWFENIPIVSYLVLGGVCRTCRQPISPVYPAVELATAAAFVATSAVIPFGLLLLARLVLASALIVLFAIDLEHRILPNEITLSGIAAGLIFSLWLPPYWRASVTGAVAGGGILLAIAWAYRRVRGAEGLGMGDVKMLAMIGAFLGWKLMLVTLVLASVAGSIVGLAMMAAKKGTLQYALPFGTFLAAGALAASLVGQPLLDWYLGFFP